MKSKLSLPQFKVLFFVQSLFALLLAAPGVASASDIIIKNTNYPIPSGAYFVSPDGKNTNSGKAPNSPWPVARAIQLAPSEATIVFRGGTYRNINLGINKKLTLQPYAQEKVWIKGSIEVQGWVADGTIWRKDGWTYSFPSNVSSEYIDPNYPMAGYRDMVYINSVPLKQVASKAEVVAGTFYVLPGTKQLYIGDNPVGKTVEATALKEAFFTWSSDSSSASHTTVRGLGFAHFADRAIGVGTSHVTLENNTFVWNGMRGVNFWGTNATDAIVRGNIFSFNGLAGVDGGSVHRMLLEGNEITYNNVERFSNKWAAAGVKVTTTNGVIWRKNFVENNFANGLWLDVSSTNARLVNNTVRNNQATGILFETSHKAIIAANIVNHNKHIGISVSNSSSASVYNNTFADNSTDLRIGDTTRNNTNASEIAAGITWIARNNVVKNNILSNATGGALFVASNCDTKEQSALMIPAADYNAYYRTSSSTPPNAIIWSVGDGWSNELKANKCSVPYPSIAAFNAATAYEAHALAIDNVTPNPFFIDEANRNYHLKPGSPAIGHGEPLPPDVAQAIGLPSGVKVDLGALQATVY